MTFKIDHGISKTSFPARTWGGALILVELGTRLTSAETWEGVGQAGNCHTVGHQLTLTLLLG